jgi:hypothetical protein
MLDAQAQPPKEKRHLRPEKPERQALTASIAEHCIARQLARIGAEIERQQTGQAAGE